MTNSLIKNETCFSYERISKKLEVNTISISETLRQTSSKRISTSKCDVCNYFLSNFLGCFLNFFAIFLQFLGNFSGGFFEGIILVEFFEIFCEDFVWEDFLGGFLGGFFWEEFNTKLLEYGRN